MSGKVNIPYHDQQLEIYRTQVAFDAVQIIDQAREESEERLLRESRLIFVLA